MQPETKPDTAVSSEVLRAHVANVPRDELHGFILAARLAFADEVRLSSRGTLSVAELTASRDRRVVLAELLDALEERLHAPRPLRLAVSCDCHICTWDAGVRHA